MRVQPGCKGVRPAVVVVFAFEVSAFAVGYEAPTRATIIRRPAGRVDPGTKVTIGGRSGSPRRACTRNKVILPMQVGKGVVDRDRTNDGGRYRFERRSRRTKQFLTKFLATRRGVHPNEYLPRLHIEDDHDSRPSEQRLIGNDRGRSLARRYEVPRCTTPTTG
jgi:hypothetical protein